MRLISTLEYNRHLSNIDILNNDDVLHIYDVFDQEYINFVLTKGIPKYVVSDHITKSLLKFNEIQFCGLPLYAKLAVSKISNNIQYHNDTNTSYCFNFMINKKQINRILCIKFVELFELTNFDYTWSAVDQTSDLSSIIAETHALGNNSPLNSRALTSLLSPIQLTRKFIEFETITANKSGIENYGGIDWAWKHIMHKLFAHSAISLITESVGHQLSSVFTEKTVYSVLGLTFPIWIGGYNQANEWKRIGFDTFDDVIDHGYQSYETLLERCYYAFALNLKLLSDKDKSTELRLLHKDRLIKNRELLLQHQLDKFVNQEINKLPQDLQETMPKILKYFR